jgi:uncharacterized protein YjdB
MPPFPQVPMLLGPGTRPFTPKRGGPHQTLVDPTRRFRRLWLSLVPLMLASCSDSSATAPPTEDKSVASVEITSSPDTLRSIGATVRLSAVARDASGSTTADAAISWTSLGPSVSTVSSDGTVTAVANGSALILATSGTAADTATVIVRQDPASLELLSGEQVLRPGQSATLEAELRDANEHPILDAVLAWSSSDEAVGQVDGNGVVTAIAPGTAWILASHGLLRDSVSLTAITVHQGDLNIEDADDLAAFAIAGYQGVAGSININNTQLQNLNGLEAIRDVDGRLNIHDNSQLQNIDGLSGVRITRGIDIRGNGAVQSLRMPALDSVAGEVYVDNIVPGAEISFPALRHTFGLVLFRESTGDLVLPSLELVFGWTVIDLDGLRSISLPSLRCVWGLFRLGGTSLESVSAPALSTIGLCPEVDYGMSSGYALELSASSSLTSLELPNLTLVNGPVTIERTGLSTIDLPSLGVAHWLTVDRSPVQVISLPQVEYLDGLSLTNLTADSLTVPAIGSAVYISRSSMRYLLMQTTSEPITLFENPLLETVELPDQVSGGLEFEGNASLQTVTFPRLESGGRLSFNDNPALQTVSAPLLTEVGMVYLMNSPSLTSVAFPNLASVASQITVTTTGLGDLNAFGGVRSALGRGLDIANNPSLTDVSGLGGLGDDAGQDPIVPAGNMYGGGAAIRDNAALSEAAVQALLAALEGKYPGIAFPGGVTTGGNGG